MTHPSEHPPLRVERRPDGVALVTIDRPEKRNAMTPEVMCRLADLWGELDTDDTVRSVVVTGAGDDAFSAGADLGRLIPLLSGTRPPEDEWDRRIDADPATVTRALLKGTRIDKPVIAAVNGVAVAGGCELVLATDLRIAAPHVRLGLSEVRRGLVPAGGGTVRLARQVPQAVAMELLLTGDTIDAARASELGLLNRVVDADAVLDEAIALATRISSNGPLAVRAIKRIVLEASGAPLAEAFDLEHLHTRGIAESADAVEGARAFLERRPARFEGR